MFLNNGWLSRVALKCVKGFSDVGWGLFNRVPELQKCQLCIFYIIGWFLPTLHSWKSAHIPDIRSASGVRTGRGSDVI